VLIIVRADETAQQAVVDAIALVDKDVPVRAVLNRCKPSLLGSYYGQHYYGYGHGRGDDEQRGGRATGEGDA
jgi:hypothetical protein